MEMYIHTDQLCASTDEGKKKKKKKKTIKMPLFFFFSIQKNFVQRIFSKKEKKQNKTRGYILSIVQGRPYIL
jgi:hypothetical protein